MLKKVAITLVVLLIISLLARYLSTTLIEPDESDPSSQTMIFEVSVPEYTPQLDTIVIHIGNEIYPMTDIGQHVYRFLLNASELYQEGWIIDYGYSRGGFDPFGEPGLTTPYWPRQTTIDFGDKVVDEVTEWKWFPKHPLNETDIPSLALSAEIAPRDDFWAGALMIDFWTESFEFQFDATIQHMKDMGYEWMALAPPWDIKDEGIPLIDYVNVTVPAYPDDKLRLHIREFKNAGFKVILMPQICCSVVNTTDKSESWWNGWYDQLENFVQYHADVAKDENVDAMEFGTSLFAADLEGDELNPEFINATEEWIDLIDIAKSSGALVGFQTYSWGATYDDLPLQEIRPWPSYAVDFYDRLDFVGINLWGDVVNTTTPTQTDFDAGMERIFTQMEGIHNDTGLPIILPQVAYASHTGSGLQKGPETFYTWGEPEDAPFEYNAEEQAMIYEAIMRQVAKRDYILGVFPFGYWYVDAPLTVDDMSIRAKMAERILVQWYDEILDTQPPSNAFHSSSIHLPKSHHLGVNPPAHRTSAGVMTVYSKEYSDNVTDSSHLSTNVNSFRPKYSIT